MPDGAKTAKGAQSQAERRTQRLAAALRANLGKRKQQARSRAAVKPGEEPGPADKAGD